MTSENRQRMVDSAVLLLRERGLSGTSMRDVVAHSGGPRGSLQHYFPGGKEQLAADAVRHAGIYVTEQIESLALNHSDAASALREFVSWWRAVLTDSDFRAGCPVVAVAVEAPGTGASCSSAVEAAATAFERWERALTSALVGFGAGPEAGRRLACLLVCSVEGAVAVCRARRSTQPLDDVATELEARLRAVLPPA